jgi:hypothetical protein
MATMLRERTFSELLRHSGEVARDAESVDVVLHRRDGPDLMLVEYKREEGLRETFTAAASILSSMMQVFQEHLEKSADGIGDSLAWTTFLTERERLEFVREFVRGILAGAQAGTFTPAAQILREWRATAMVHADPELVAVLNERVPSEDGGLVALCPPADDVEN